MVSAILLTRSKYLGRWMAVRLFIKLVVSLAGMPPNIIVPPHNTGRPSFHLVGNCRLDPRLSKTHNKDISHPRTDKGTHRARLAFGNTVVDEGSRLVEGRGYEGQVLMKPALLE